MIITMPTRRRAATGVERKAAASTSRSSAKHRRVGRAATLLAVLSLLLAFLLPASVAAAQTGSTRPIQTSAGDESAATPESMLNPVSVIEEGSKAIPGFEDGLSAPLNFLILLTVLSLAPSILVMTTCFTRFVIVLALTRQAIGTGTLPPSQVITGIALLLTFVVMHPTIERVYDEAIVPYQQGDPNVVSQLDVWSRAREPIRDFMFAQIDAADGWGGVYMILEYRGHDLSEMGELTYDDVDMLTLIPAFIISELKVAFLIGIRIYLPFLIIDMVIASLLISMGMLMLPPVLISLPFKLLLFVLVDGWHLIVGNLLLRVEQSARSTPETYGTLLHAARAGFV